MYYPYGMYFDWTYILVIIGLVLSLGASALVNSTFKKYSRVRSSTGVSGQQAAERILRSEGLNDVAVNHIGGNLTDNYNPSQKTVNLSDATYASSSVASIGVAAHECGHAMQHASGYFPLTLRSAILPVANFGSMLGIPICIIGLIMGQMGDTVIKVGILLFSFAVLFQLVTLPVEFNASRRALAKLKADGILYPEELNQTRKVLTAAALTYVAAAAASILQLIRLWLIFGNRRSD
ncbi:MAG: zinc metallopeptidase [Lachnospiraceae bacterium]|nr:zinc metallopeptidase [Lachnospiraceae bacterium]